MASGVPLSPELIQDLVDLAEQLRNLGASEFAVGEFRVVFRTDAPVNATEAMNAETREWPAEVTVGPPPLPSTRKGQYQAAFGGRLPSLPSEAKR
jgi:hypothetical protein